MVHSSPLGSALVSGAQVLAKTFQSSTTNHVYDPISTLARLSYITYLPGAKLHFGQTGITVQPAGTWQSIERSFRHFLRNRDHEGELGLLATPIQTFIHWHLITTETASPLINKITQMAISGLKILKTTSYANKPTPQQALEHYIFCLKQKLADNDYISDNEQLKKLWTPIQLESLYTQLRALEEAIESQEPIDSAIGAIETILQKKDNQIQSLLIGARANLRGKPEPLPSKEEILDPPQHHEKSE